MALRHRAPTQGPASVSRGANDSSALLVVAALFSQKFYQKPPIGPPATGIPSLLWPDGRPRESLSRAVSSLPFVAKRILPLAVIATAAISVPAMALSRGGLARLDALREERRRADQDAARLAREIERLRAEVRRIKEDPASVERAARDELGLVRQTEVVFQFRR